MLTEARVILPGAQALLGFQLAIVLTDTFDLATGMPWPEGVSGRAIANRFSRRWHGREEELRAWVEGNREEYLASATGAEVDEHAVWAGEASALVTRVESARTVVAELAREAADVLAGRVAAVSGH